MYLTTMAQKPHVVAKGKNFCHKGIQCNYNAGIPRKQSSFQRIYFKKCICAAIIYRTVDSYLEINKDSAKSKQVFGIKVPVVYKLDIVPYTISKILYSIPNGYTLNWDYIWNHQKVSPAFMREIELVTKMTNDFICDSHGIIVTEYCKKKTLG